MVAGSAAGDAGGQASGETGDPLANLLEHTAALLLADNDQTLWPSLAEYVLYEVHEQLFDLGRLDMTKLALRAFEGWLDQFPPEKAAEAAWLRERSVFHDQQGDVLRDEGDLTGALSAHRESLRLSQRGAALDPSNTQWQRGLFVSYVKVGDVLRDQGDLAGALSAYRESLRLSQRLAAFDPSNTRWQRDLSILLTRLSEIEASEGNRVKALRFAQESLKIGERLAALDASNPTWQRDLALSRALVARLRM